VLNRREVSRLACWQDVTWLPITDLVPAHSTTAPSAPLPDLGAVFAALPASYVLLAPDFAVLAVNDAYLRAVGMTRQQMLGRGLFDVLRDHPDDPDASGAASLRASLLRVQATRQPDTMPLQRYEFRATDGSVEGRYWSPLNTPVLDAGGNLAYIIHHVEDVTPALHAHTHAMKMELGILARAQQIRHQDRPAEQLGQSPTFMAVLSGPRHLVELMDEGFLRLVGHSDIVGRPVTDGFDQATGGTYAELLDGVYRTGRSLAAGSALYPVQDEAGGPVTARYIDFAFKPIRGEAGAVEGIFIEGVDVTERVQDDARRDALVRLTDALRDLRSADDIAYTAVQVLGETLGASRVGYGQFDAAREEIHVRRDWTAAGVASVQGVHRLRSFGSFVDELVRGNSVVVADVTQDPRTMDGQEAMRLARNAAIVCIPVLEGGLLQSVLFVNDSVPRRWADGDVALMKEVAERTRTASERARSVEALRDSEAKFRTIANAMPQMVWSTMPDGYHDYYNQQWYDYTGVRPGSTDGEGWNGMFHADDRERAWAAWRHSLDTGAVYEIQYRLRHRSGEYRWVLGRALPLHDEAGAIVRWMGTCTDIHSQKLAEDELREAAARKDEFLAMLAHELRNPLAPIITAAQLLQTSRADEAIRQRAGDIIVRQVKHMTHLVDDLLDVSRVTRGLVKLDMQELDLKQVVGSAVEQALPLVETRGHALDVRRPAARAHVLGDRTRLIQVIANVLNNAAKYTPPGGRIALDVEVDAGQARVIVRDNGNGIAPALLPHIFDLFIQGERNPDRAQGGLGLGLTLVKSITMLHQGFVTAHSDGPGLGSTFTICLPLLGEADTPQPLPLSPSVPVAAGPRSLRLLIVDDNLDGALSLAELLRADGHDVAVAEDAESALRHADLAAMDAFILDIGLPGMDGYALARHLRGDPATAKARLIALTGYGQPGDRELSRAAGFDRHLVKPADLQQLAQALAGQG
jgi:PAS domain S-box-containing protein